MSISKSERHQIENEMIFRRMNEKIASGLENLKAMHIEDGNKELIQGNDMKLMFICECSDENCTTRLPLSIQEYQDIHENRKSFIIEVGHQVDPIEKVIERRSTFNVVRKNNTVEEPSSTLNDTIIDNS